MSDDRLDWYMAICCRVGLGTSEKLLPRSQLLGREFFWKMVWIMSNNSCVDSSTLIFSIIPLDYGSWVEVFSCYMLRIELEFFTHPSFCSSHEVIALFTLWSVRGSSVLCSWSLRSVSMIIYIMIPTTILLATSRHSWKKMVRKNIN